MSIANRLGELSLCGNYVWVIALASVSNRLLYSSDHTWLYSALTRVLKVRSVIEDVMQLVRSELSDGTADVLESFPYEAWDSIKMVACDDELDRHWQSISEPIADIASHVTHVVNVLIAKTSVQDRWLLCSSNTNDVCMSCWTGSVDVELLYDTLSALSEEAQGINRRLSSPLVGASGLPSWIEYDAEITLDRILTLNADTRDRSAVQSSVSGTSLVESCELMCSVCITSHLDKRSR